MVQIEQFELTNTTNGNRKPRKFSTGILGFITGLLLFAVSFSILLENTAFNERFYKSAFEQLGAYSRIAELAGIPAKELTAKITEPSAAAVFSINTSVNSLVEDNVSNEMVRLNVDSLLSGLISYFKGETNSLPDFYLSDSAALRNINLQVLIMYMGESCITNILRLITLSQFILNHTPAMLLIFFPLILVLILNKSTKKVYLWLRSTAFFFCMISFAAGLLIQLIPSMLLEPLLLDIASSQSSLAELISLHISYFINILTVLVLLSGTLTYIGVHALSHLIKHTTDVSSLQKCNKNNTGVLITIALLSGLLFFTNIQFISKEFFDQNLEQSLSLLWEGNPLYRVTNARDDLVYLLQIQMVDSNSKPAANIKINIESSGSITKAQNLEGFILNQQNSSMQTFGCTTDENGTAVFLLDKGLYTLALDYNNLSIASADTKLQSYQFEMKTPGKSILNVKLEKDEKTSESLYIADASLQYIP